jgi:hypothetical protein
VWLYKPLYVVMEEVPTVAKEEVIVTAEQYIINICLIISI